MKERTYRARILKDIYWKDATVKAGTEIDVTGAELKYLGPVAISIAVDRSEAVETATIRPSENAMKRRR